MSEAISFFWGGVLGAPARCPFTLFWGRVELYWNRLQKKQGALIVASLITGGPGLVSGSPLLI